jgi:uncharacterized protein YjcR
MKRRRAKIREEARKLFLTGQMHTNSEIAARLRVKPHTVGKWRRDEDWDGLRTKIDIRAAEVFAEKIANDRVSLNLKHFRFWDLLLAKLTDDLKRERPLDIRDIERIATVVDRAQKGQRLARGLSTGGETEEAIRAQSIAETRRIIDAFIQSVKENVADEQTRDRIRRSILDALPAEADSGASQPHDQVLQ